MEIFDKITIQEMPRDDMFIIIHALAYTAQKTGIKKFADLKDELISELSALADISESEFIALLEKETQSI